MMGLGCEWIWMLQSLVLHFCLILYLPTLSTEHGCDGFLFRDTCSSFL